MSDLKLPHWIMVEPTNQCNLRCPGCPIGKGLTKGSHEMTSQQYCSIIDQLCCSVKLLLLWGYGEPTLHKDLCSMIDYAYEKGIDAVWVATNGHFLDNALAMRLLGTRLDSIQVSLDGCSEETYRMYRKKGDFEKVISNLRHLVLLKRLLQQEKPMIELKFLIMKHNEHEIPSMKRIARELGVDRLILKTVGIFAGDEHMLPVDKNMSRYHRNLSGKACRYPWEFALIRSDGTINACHYRRTDMGYVMGNIFRQDFRSIWQNHKYLELRKQLSEDRHSLPVCVSCVSFVTDLNYGEIAYDMEQ